MTVPNPMKTMIAFSSSVELCLLHGMLDLDWCVQLGNRKLHCTCHIALRRIEPETGIPLVFRFVRSGLLRD